VEAVEKQRRKLNISRKSTLSSKWENKSLLGY
jgi:hypothetical protein